MLLPDRVAALLVLKLVLLLLKLVRVKTRRVRLQGSLGWLHQLGHTLASFYLHVDAAILHLLLEIQLGAHLELRGQPLGQNFGGFLLLQRCLHLAAVG